MSDSDRRKHVSFDELTLHYQPQVAADGSRIVSVEALLRVLKPEPRLMTPADVLAFFEAPEDAEALDWWVFRTAARDGLRWPELTVGINVSAARFRDPGFADAALAVAREIGADPRRLEIEIVESSFIEDFETAVGNIDRLRAHGFRVALDDFGTGYSSLTYLLKLPIDKLKIDKSFVDGIGTIQSTVIVQAVVALARALGLKITAEGVETEEQWRFLKIAGCHLMQGWYFAKAVSADEITRLVEARIAPRAVA
ncbi:MAG: EAL domain-containing protein [Phyllobacteriaceae bacterium]|nr:EAL domain-containing protein [Phyllobacteriaceae bacterium]